MSDPVRPVIRRYAAGEISATKAADLLGEHATVADVFVMTRRAGLHAIVHRTEIDQPPSGDLVVMPEACPRSIQAP